jgi:hypothetical protein
MSNYGGKVKWECVIIPECERERCGDVEKEDDDE